MEYGRGAPPGQTCCPAWEALGGCPRRRMSPSLGQHLAAHPFPWASPSALQPFGPSVERQASRCWPPPQARSPTVPGRGSRDRIQLMGQTQRQRPQRPRSRDPKPLPAPPPPPPQPHPTQQRRQSLCHSRLLLWTHCLRCDAAGTVRNPYLSIAAGTVRNQYLS